MLFRLAGCGGVCAMTRSAEGRAKEGQSEPKDFRLLPRAAARAVGGACAPRRDALQTSPSPPPHLSCFSFRLATPRPPVSPRPPAASSRPHDVEGQDEDADEVAIEDSHAATAHRPSRGLNLDIRAVVPDGARPKATPSCSSGGACAAHAWLSAAAGAAAGRLDSIQTALQLRK